MATFPMLRYLLVLLLSSCTYAPIEVRDDSYSTRVAGSSIAQGLLLRLADPKDTEYRVGIINTAAEFGVLISPKDAAPSAQYFRGYSSRRESPWNLSWLVRDTIAYSLDNLSYEITRSQIDSQNCPDLEETLDQFYSQLEVALERPILLSEIERKPRQRLEQVTVDGTSYIIQISTSDSTVVIYPNRDVANSLDNVAASLMGVIGACANDALSEIERHRGW